MDIIGRYMDTISKHMLYLYYILQWVKGKGALHVEIRDKNSVGFKAETKADGCDFCSPDAMTAGDVWPEHHLHSTHATTSSNVFKYDAYHGLVIAKEHDPLKLNRIAFTDMLTTARTWFQVCHSTDSQFKYPHLMWDLLPKASASQLHPHAQVSLTPDRYYGAAEDMRQAAVSCLLLL
ncbi:hypothetical protein SARC_02292 [Sphaeroforma arctica JP610]|uniref:Uncharacterized protein n=1 Tax=Sphaeroforma arctica JP610 TaxID=667725 RepID=A0A0L0G9G9_9EUKA|nr:hypothetical protein SARC_02292 [Sphaeroforma arctica JP610]KNC85531.1 hypothetical protein SARC_02292 [Sphaeroforma arctica JP610]|eukprot:XP_014159433.1 hypothetical protein SARC_02292 [Sphaeroforma arctica JP610]